MESKTLVVKFACVCVCALIGLWAAIMAAIMAILFVGSVMRITLMEMCNSDKKNVLYSYALFAFMFANVNLLQTTSSAF